MTTVTLAFLTLATVALILSISIQMIVDLRSNRTPVVVDTAFRVEDRSFLGQPRFVVVGRPFGRVVGLPTSNRRHAGDMARAMTSRACLAA